MNNSFSPEDIEFQQEVRAFFKEQFTDELRQRVELANDTKNVAVEWQTKLNDKGWVAVDWPVELGGTGWSPVQKFIYETERCNAGAPDVVPFGLKMVAPVIYTFGNLTAGLRMIRAGSISITTGAVTRLGVIRVQIMGVRKYVNTFLTMP
jgi:alkylation response protein AidB-like acyl-CoA dehydrogenase